MSLFERNGVVAIQKVARIAGASRHSRLETESRSGPAFSVPFLSGWQLLRSAQIKTSAFPYVNFFS